MSELILRLPYPPSVNHYWKTRSIKLGNKYTRIVYISSKGIEFRRSVANVVIVNRVKGFGGSLLRMEVKLYPPDRRRRDVDNVLKALFDSLQHAGVYNDDSQIKQLYIEMLEKREGGEVEITLRAIE